MIFDDDRVLVLQRRPFAPRQHTLVTGTDRPVPFSLKQSHVNIPAGAEE
jgi:hypothetical protein